MRTFKLQCSPAFLSCVAAFRFDFIGHMAFGREFDMLKAGSDHLGLIHAIEEGV